MHVHGSSRMFLIPTSPPAVVCFDAWISLFTQASVAHHVVASLIPAVRVTDYSYLDWRLFLIKIRNAYLFMFVFPDQ